MADGLNKIVNTAGKGLGKFEAKVDDIFYGTEKKKGIFDKVLALNEVDPCSIVNFYSTKLNTDLIKNEKVKEKLEKIKTVASDLNNLISDYTTFSTTTNQPRSVNSLNITPTSSFNTTREKTYNLLVNIKQIGVEIFATIPPELLSLAPKLKDKVQLLNDFSTILTRYNSLEDIPNQDIQKIVRKIYDVQGVLGSIASIGSAQGIIGLSPELQRQIQKLQQFLDPSKILPILKDISKTLRAISQISAQVLKIVSLVRMVVRVLTGLLTAFKIIILFFQTLPLPNLFSVHGITSTLETAKEKANESITGFRKTLKDLGSLLDLVYSFIVGLVAKIDLLNIEVRKLIIKIEACSTLDSTIEDLNTSATQLDQVTNQLKVFADAYKAKRSNSALKYESGGVLITVEEEEIVDEGKKLKRRRAIAVDERGQLIDQGPLTFATDKTILIEELRLKLEQQGLLSQNNTPLSVEDRALLDDVLILADFDIEAPPQDELRSDQAEVQAELSSFVDGLKNARRLRKKVQSKVTAQTATLKTQLQSTGQAQLTGQVALSANNTTASSSFSKNILSDKEREDLKNFVKKFKTSRIPGMMQKINEAEQKLKADAEARARLATG